MTRCSAPSALVGLALGCGKFEGPEYGCLISRFLAIPVPRYPGSSLSRFLAIPVPRYHRNGLVPTWTKLAEYGESWTLAYTSMAIPSNRRLGAVQLGSACNISATLRRYLYAIPGSTRATAQSISNRSRLHQIQLNGPPSR